MQDQEGRDPIVRAAAAGGWIAPEKPVPLIVSKLCESWKPLFIDVGANGGFFSLLAAVIGASRVWSFEPDPGLQATLQANVEESSLTQTIRVRPCVLDSMPENNPTDHVLDSLFASEIVGIETGPLILRIDRKLSASKVLIDGGMLLKKLRPAIFLEFSADSNKPFFDALLKDNGYTRFSFTDVNKVEGKKTVPDLNLSFPTHIFVPDELVQSFVHTLA
jgi:hypothetical protein